ncbi:MAG: TolC family protein [Flavobacteriales bacterium]|nr:TolC family protein [Flavobacteriales bacterium]
MHKNIALVLCGCLITLGGFAQSPGIQAALQSIEQNNLELKAISSLNEKIGLQLRSENQPPDPQIGGYYLPFGDHTPGDYSEFEISQSIEFPTVYAARKKWNEARTLEAELQLSASRQEILLEAQQLCMELIHLRKRSQLEQERYDQANRVVDQAEALHEKGQIGILELNKAKVAWMQVQFNVQRLDNEKDGFRLSLRDLNGGMELTLQTNEYEGELTLPEQEVLWQEVLAKDPILRQLEQGQAISAQGVKVAKSQGLPDLTAGYNYQGIAGSNYSGVYAGLSIPLWSNRHKVKAALSDLAFQEAFSSAETVQAQMAFEKRYRSYELLSAEYEQYTRTLDGLNSEALLLQAYELGEISFLEYHMELQFYRQAIDAMLQREKEMHQLKADLQRHLL